MPYLLTHGVGNAQEVGLGPRDTVILDIHSIGILCCKYLLALIQGCKDCLRVESVRPRSVFGIITQGIGIRFASCIASKYLIVQGFYERLLAFIVAVCKKGNQSNQRDSNNDLFYHSLAHIISSVVHETLHLLLNKID